MGETAADEPARRDVWIARALVGGQFALLGALVLLPVRQDWPVPEWLQVAALAGMALGLVIMLVGGTALGRGLTAVPLPNRHARLRTGGLYRWVRHPIYTGLLLLAGSVAVRSASVPRLGVFLVLLALITVKARWEEGHLARRFSGYPAYAAITPRFVPRPWRWPRHRSDDDA